VTINQARMSFKLNEYLDYVRYKTILARTLHDKSVHRFLLKMDGKVLELGAGTHDYSRIASKSAEYIRSDYKPPKGDVRIKIDATAITYPDCSFDGVVCMSALEHIKDCDKVFSEVYRILKPGGRFLLCTPWLFPKHGAPDDYHRFSSSLLQSKLSAYEIEEFEAVGNFWLTQAVFLQRPKWSRLKAASRTRFYDGFLRMIGVIFMIIGSRNQKDDDNYSLLYTCMCRK